MENPVPPLTNLQRELLRIFSLNVPEEDLKKIRSFLARMFAEKAMDEADIVWEQEAWTKEKVAELSNAYLRSLQSDVPETMAPSE